TTSTRTMSPSSLDAAQWAAVAPTLPAPTIVILARFRGIWLVPPSAGLVKNPRSKLIRASNRATNPVTVYHVRQFPGKPSLGHTRRRLSVSWPPDARNLRWDGRCRKERPRLGESRYLRRAWAARKSPGGPD